MKPRQSRTAAYPPRPPRERGTGRAFLLAALMHVLLALFLYHGVHWQNSTPAGAEAELWTSVPDTSTPRPVPTPPVKVAPPPPPVKNEEADIALQQKRREQQAAAAREAQLEEQRRQQQLKAQQLAAQQAAQLAAQKAAEREKQKQAEKLKQQQLAEQQRKLEQQKLEQQKLEQQKKQEQLAAQKKANAEKAEKAAKAAAAAKANAAANAKLDKERQARLAQLQGIAGGGSGGGEGLAKSGTGTGSGGNAASPGYADKVRRRVKPNIVWAGERDSLVTVVAIRCTPSGDVLSTSIRRSSGNSGWDQAVISAIQASVPLPPDTNGRTPAEITITFKAAE
ncbi:cell envelope integrity protein TolA [Burkholderia oklahomensis]|uniref:cell envelope integrity protein TolA n=1 Tax=Burkholderia oklahomensis TaxID=342113 RepID=UPI00016A9E69|nr:cell envelope integrity protein TolA [Burkholderia oklahomensis]AJX31549.1 protein TolA [Burkholderia oklahomensis C6786]AOI45032.1 protein TolA [Burkholderia oklahomensis C6786]KUY65496.1 protein TolA [Burkholderia oklahomensis C6786]MBI0358926.1 cell envelope integrity protein TolA [Burkholderia oklahomensis]SUW57501.1 Membrane protein involved in colicin uptake [Burkholderia oklahomensis]